MSKYKVIYADPPWSYNNKKTGGSTTSGAVQKYDTMSLEDLKQMDLQAADNSILFMWATIPLLDQAFDLMDSWGFEYKTSLVWEKENHYGLGYWFRGCVEILMVGIRGDVKPFRANMKNIIKAPIQEHSKKPDVFRKLIERITFDAQPRIEYFARTRIHGWDTFGNDQKLSLKPLESYT